MGLGQLMTALLSSRMVNQPTQIQPQPATVQRVFYKAHMVARPVGSVEGFDINVTRDVLSVPVWGATNPNAFITVSGQPPATPTVTGVASIAGSNAIQGGSC